MGASRSTVERPDEAVSGGPGAHRLGGGDRSVSAASAGSRPRLLVLTPDFPPAYGGIQTHMHRIASGVEGFDTRVVTRACPGAGRFDADSGLSIRRVRASGPAGVQVGRLAAAGLLETARWRPELILSAHIVTSPAAALARLLLGTKTVQFFYAKEIGARPKLAAFAVRNADASIAISCYSAGLVGSTGASTAALRLIPPGVDIPDVTTPIPTTRPTVLTIARLEDAYKGHDVLLDALVLVRRRVPDVQWVVLGDGRLRGGLEARALALGLADAVRFLGAVNQEQRNSWLRQADLLAMPSRLPGGRHAGEGFGIVYLEAGAYGKPVVAGNVAGALDAVRDGESGLLVDPTDVLSVADAITRLLLDRGLAERLGETGARRAREFAWPTIVRRVEAVLTEQLESQRASRRHRILR